MGGGMQADDGDISSSLCLVPSSRPPRPSSLCLVAQAGSALERLPILQQHQHGPRLRHTGSEGPTSLPTPDCDCTGNNTNMKVVV